VKVRSPYGGLLLEMYHYRIKSVDRVVDGDTIDVTIDLGFDIYHKTRVRLAGIDTPETRTRDLQEKAAGIRAKDYLTKRIEEANLITLQTEKTGKFGRYLGIVYADDVDLNQTLIEEGHAEVYGGGKRK
jgi:endonuclease YncB( thermonuclease family)